MENPPTLESVAAAFQHWRVSRSHKGKTPAPLRALALALLKHHQPSQVKAALNINSTMLAAWRAEDTEAQVEPSSTTAFIELPPSPPMQTALPGETIEVMITGRHGAALHACGPLTPAHLGALAQACVDGREAS